MYIPVLLWSMYHFMIVDQSNALLTCLYVHIMYNYICTISTASSSTRSSSSTRFKLEVYNFKCVLTNASGDEVQV